MQSSEIEMQKPLSLIIRSSKIEHHVVHLMALLVDQNKGPNFSITQSKVDPNIADEEEDPMRLLAIKINLANAIYLDQFSNSTQFDVEKPKIYFIVM